MTRYLVFDFEKPRIFITTKYPEDLSSNCQWMQLNAKLEKDIHEANQWLRKRKQKKV